ncbi:MAG TPA: VWA domain-containing protein [Candidatus Gemmiger avium]|nr:VWA domain-containing protein [Candidatus Gemmiger avium]
MGITSSNKQVSAASLDCDGTLKVTLALAAAPDITENPTDILLVLDRSGSMAGSPLASMKAGAKEFIDILDRATDSAADGHIGGGSRIGVVSFADTATTDIALVTSVSALKSAVDGLTAGGDTNHADAFSRAMSLFDPLSANAKVIVLFTDGRTTAGPPPAPVAAAARAAGCIIYCIGLTGSDGLDLGALNDWATDPNAAHVAIAPDEGELEELFRDLAVNIAHPGATGIVIDEVVNSDFIITSITPPSRGTAMTVAAGTLQWKIPELGVSGNEGAVLEFYIRHVGQTCGEKQVNASITYHDNEGNRVRFPSPTVQVECGMVVKPEPCPTPVEMTMDSCRDCMEVDMGEVWMESQGRILQLDVTVKNVCPGRRVALAVILTELDSAGGEHPRGMKTITVPAHSCSGCRDVLVRCVKFVLPEDLTLSGSCRNSLCGTRRFKARCIAHPIDTDYCCCGLVPGDGN